MSIQSSFPTVAEQILTFNKNIVEILSKINALTTTTDPSINLQVINERGIMSNMTLPSFSYLKSEIERLNNNINSLYSIDSTASAMIMTSNDNKFRKIITVDLNREPNPIGSLGEISSFTINKNWFFDSMLNPMLTVELDLRDKIENDVRKCLSRRYIVEFDRNQSGNLTPNGESALNSFNTLFRNVSSINIEEFESWYKTTPGVSSPSNPIYDEEIFDLDPNEMLYDGLFSVLSIEEDRLNKKLWYVINNLDYIVSDTNNVRQLSINDELVINTPRTSSKYKIIEISNSESLPRIRLERVEGLEPIPVGTNILKIYSPVVYTKKLRISVGYNERNVIFIKPLSTDNNILAKKWSLGTGFWTNDLRLNSNDTQNGLSMEQFYVEYVQDYGDILQDMVAKKIPNKLAVIPNAPSLNINNFKVVQINKHLTDTPDSKLLRQKHNVQVSLQSEIRQIQEAIIERNKKVRTTKFISESEKKQFELEMEDLSKKRESKSRLLSSVTQEILDLSKSPLIKSEPKFKIRGFWEMPNPAIERGTKPQEVIQFIIQYKYLSKDGRETPIETFDINNPNGSNRVASFSNWNEIKTDIRKRTYSLESDLNKKVFNQQGGYTWLIENNEGVDNPNINQLDLAINPNEKVEVRIKSISEAGWPESPVESEWSESIIIEFPDDLNSVLNESEFIINEATKEELLNRVENQLSSKGLDNHLVDNINLNGKQFHHEASKIISGFRDENGAPIDLFEYIKGLEERIKGLEEKIKRAKGELEIIIYRGNQEFVIANGSETVFNIECEDYLEKFTDVNIPTGRVYANNVYVIKDFVVKIRNKSSGSSLGLLSSKIYLQNSSAYNSKAPQVFWVNNQDELLFSDISGSSRTQLNNQFIWCVNYDSVRDQSVTKLSENIGNRFKLIKGKTLIAKNSLTPVLGSNQYNLGYNENSILSFVGNNRSLLEFTKWIDPLSTVASTTKLLTSIHPVIPNLESIVENNTDKIKTINSGDENSITIPINIYFKMNALNNSQKENNFILLNNATQTVKHIKKIKFLLENEAENRPFEFSIKFNINRNRVIVKKFAELQTRLTR
jgi:hypothetical protein